MRMAHIQDERWVHVINVHLIAPTASNAVLSVAPFCMPRAVVYEAHNSPAGCAVLLCSIRLITQVITGIRVVKLLHWEPPYVALGSESAHCLGAPPSLATITHTTPYDAFRRTLFYGRPNISQHRHASVPYD
jgi:hypothetical protein